MIEGSINSDLMVKAGMAKARATREPWLPSPGQFCEWCRPSAEDLGLPPLERAFTEARMELSKHSSYRKWSHKAVYLAASAVGIFELKTLADNSPQYRDIKARFSTEYAKIAEKVKSGEIIEVPKENRIAKQPVISDTPESRIASEKAVSNILRGL